MYLAPAHIRAPVIREPVIRPARLVNQNDDGTFRCCGGYGEHFDTCLELCCLCGGAFDDLPPTSWNRRRHNGPNGFPAHAGCLEDQGWDAYKDRPHADEPIDVDDDSRPSGRLDQDLL
jgi:hypothetical protein